MTHDFRGTNVIVCTDFSGKKPHKQVDTDRVGWLVSSFISWQHLRSYQNGYWLVTVHTHGDFIVLPHWETRPSAPRLPTLSYYPVNQPISLPCVILIMQNLWLGSDKYQFSRHSLCRFGHGDCIRVPWESNGSDKVTEWQEVWVQKLF